MKRATRDTRAAILVTLSVDLLAELSQRARALDISRSQLVERAVAQYLHGQRARSGRITTVTSADQEGE